MRGDARSMKVLRPRTPKEAIELYARFHAAVPLAGGTDFMVSWNAGEANGLTVIDLSRLRTWGRIRRAGKVLRIGSLATHWQLQSHDIVRRRFPLLAQACATIGGRQIQTRGTIGGNIANASPAGDTFPPLLVYDARVRLVSSAGRRAMAIRDVFTGVKRTALESGELIESVELPFHRSPSRELFRKVGTRKASAISKTVAAGLLWLRRDGRIRALRFALGSMAVTAKRLETVESFLQGQKPTRRAVDEALSLLERDVDPIDDLRSTARYRLEVSRNLLRGFLL
ncbi:MAG TPA: FAD binding domain-containing protein [Vicinamibacteria bacterium]|nr:FAD binding domain-containing protein [Vicinamibacteria bacterium]